MNQIELQNAYENGTDPEEIAEAWLDTAIECKQAGRIGDCIEAHMQRMKVCPCYQTTDAIRLLGMGKEDTIEEVSCEGVFEIEKRSDSKFVPSKRAQKLGQDVKEIFGSRGYKLHACQSFLLPHIQDGNSIINQRRIFSSQSFLQHRHEVFDARRQNGTKNNNEPSIDSPLLGELEILVWLFLFGLAVSTEETMKVLGEEDVETLLRAKLVRTSPIDAEMLVAEVQVYPVDLRVFVHDAMEASSLFLTDWNLESLRPTHNAIMPVGYDTLELMAVTAGEMIRQKALQNRSIMKEKHGHSNSSFDKNRILDLCCGCGIQGIFAWLCYKAFVAPDETWCELVLTDINQRALHFVTANLAINGVSNDSAFGVCGDLFGSLAPQPFDLILCNPPFVAIPSPSDATLFEKTPLYGVGGGLDGMICLRRILQSLYKFLSDENAEAVALMVTEVPNVEESPVMLSSFLPESNQESARVRIAYVEDDVETMEDYAREREVEAGVDDDHNEWVSSAITSGIYNRALVLISFARSGEKEQSFGLFNFQGLGQDKNDSEYGNDSHQADPIDEEDMFLHPTGISFSWKSLLFE